MRNKKPSYTSTNKKEIHVRCPYCGDSRHDPSKARFYIEMKPPFRFHCFKCETSGVLTQQTLRDLGIYNNDLTLDIIQANKSLKNLGVQKIHIKSARELEHEPTDTIAAQNSVIYFNNRYGTNYDAKYLQEKFKAVLDGMAFIQLNRIFVPVQKFDFSKAIGFISSDKSHVIFRDISGQQATRYFNLCLVSNEAELDTSSKMYNISTSLDVMQDELHLVITEGIFDIIGVYNHFYKDTPKEKNTVFAAACGKAYNAVIQHYIRLGFLNLKITIYSDGDVNQYFYRDMKASSPYLKNNRIEVYYNANYDKNTGFGKDFGVPKDQITLKKIII